MTAPKQIPQFVAIPIQAITIALINATMTIFVCVSRSACVIEWLIAWHLAKLNAAKMAVDA
jgi:hypothetical protein